MLIISKSKVVERIKYLYSNPAYIAAHVANAMADELRSIFGDKCLFDKKPEHPSAQAEPKFKVGDKVRVVEEGRWFSESVLEPYTEESRNQSQNIANCDKFEDNQLRDNMEEKELDLGELLKGCEGEKIFLPDEGECEIVSVAESEIELSQEQNCIIKLCDESLWMKHTGFAYAYPSKDSFLANPLNAPKAWKEWKEARVNKRWHPKDGEKFWHLNEFMNVVSSCYDEESLDDFTLVEKTVNCFQSYELCQQAAQAVRETLEKFHETILRNEDNRRKSLLSRR